MSADSHLSSDPAEEVKLLGSNTAGTQEFEFGVTFRDPHSSLYPHPQYPPTGMRFLKKTWKKGRSWWIIQEAYFIIPGLTPIKKTGWSYSGPWRFMILGSPYFGPFMIPDWTIYGFRLDHRSLWFQVDHTLNHIWFQIDHGKIIEKNWMICMIIFEWSEYDQQTRDVIFSCFNLTEKVEIV